MECLANSIEHLGQAADESAAALRYSLPWQLVLSESDRKALAVEIAKELAQTFGAEINEAKNPPLRMLRIGPKEMARCLGIGRRTLSDWQRRRIIPFERIGKSRGRSTVLFDVNDVDKALRRWRTKAVGD